MPLLGLAEEHLRDAMSEVARHLLAMGARLVYGGDLRARGFSELLFELVARYRRDADVGDMRAAVVSYLPWPVHCGMSTEEIQAVVHDLKGLAEIHCLDRQGQEIALNAVPQVRHLHAPTGEDWSDSLTALRRVMTAACDARIVLGGSTAGFKGHMPGIGEEALCSLSAQQPIFVLGGFGGCARDIAEDMNLTASGSGGIAWAGRDKFADLGVSDLRNGLSSDENETLA